MKVGKGDKVRFLNAVGGGIVSRCEGKTVYVEDEDGFEIPVSENEVVVIEARAAQKAEAEEVRQAEKAAEVAAVEEEPTYTFSETAADDVSPHFCLAFLRSDLGRSGYVDLYAVNDSNCFAFFTLAEQTSTPGELRILHYGTIEPNTKLMLEKYNPQRIDNQTWRCQLLLFKKSKNFRAYEPIETVVKIKASKFFRDNAFADNDFFTEKAVVIPIIKTELDVKLEQLSEADFHSVIAQKEKPAPKQQSRRSTSELIEVDLHINEILESTAGLSNGEMLQVQLARFRHVMEENLSHKGQRIVFIHGVGNGTLKAELRKILDRDYRKVNYQDASFKEYGFGATMVTI